MGNAYTPKRGKIDRPGICKPSPPDPIPPAVPAAYFAAAVASPAQGYCDDFLVWCQAWTLLQPIGHDVQLTFLPIEWAQLSVIHHTIPNTGRRYAAAKLTNVRDGEHLLTVRLTWGAGTVREQTMTRVVTINQNCPPSIITGLFPWYKDSHGWLTLTWEYFAWKPHATTPEYYDCVITAQPGTWEQFHYNRPSSPVVAPLLSYFPAVPNTYECTARSYWPAGGVFTEPTTEDTAEATVPGQLGYVHAYLTQPDAGDDTHLQIHATAAGGLNPPLSPVELSLSLPGGSFGWLENPIGCEAGYRIAADWFNAPAGEHDFSIDATFQNGYVASWTGRLYRPVPAGY